MGSDFTLRRRTVEEVQERLDNGTRVTVNLRPALDRSGQPSQDLSRDRADVMSIVRDDALPGGRGGYEVRLWRHEMPATGEFEEDLEVKYYVTDDQNELWVLEL